MYKLKIYFCFILSSFIISHFWAGILLQNFQIDRLDDPVLGTYSSDEASFLKTFYLMEKGYGYYTAFKMSREGASRNLQADVFTWRMPTSFYIWKIVANSGKDIFSFFIFSVVLLLVSLYLILKKITNSKYAILGPLFFLPYLYDTLRYKTSFLFTEWWGLIFFIFGVCALVYKQKKLIFLFFLFSIISRELFFIPLSSILLVSMIKKTDCKKYILTALILGIVFYFIHSFEVNGFFQTTNYRFLSRFHTYHLQDLQRFFAFSMKEYIFSGFKTHYLFIIAGFLGLVMKAVRNNTAALYLFSWILAFVLLLPLFSTFDNDYWGIVFVPIIIISVPLIFPNENINS